MSKNSKVQKSLMRVAFSFKNFSFLKTSGEQLNWAPPLKAQIPQNPMNMITQGQLQKTESSHFSECFFFNLKTLKKPYRFSEYFKTSHSADKFKGPSQLANRSVLKTLSSFSQASSSY